MPGELPWKNGVPLDASSLSKSSNSDKASSNISWSIDVLINKVYVSRQVLNEFFGHMDKIAYYINVFFQVQWVEQLIR